MPPGFEILTKFRVIENLTVIDDPDGLAFVMDRLVTPWQIDDAQPYRPQSSELIRVNPRSIGSSVTNKTEHATEERGLVEFVCLEIYYSRNATHIN
jgi:hypothetical protein